jgi:hypothetical protein
MKEAVERQWERALERDPDLYRTIPVYTLEGLRNYAVDRIPTGDFLHAVLANDLFGAIGRADGENIHAIRAIVTLVYNAIPASAHGSAEKVATWLEGR